MIDSVGRLDVKSVELQARVGIATGLVVVGDLIGEGSAQEQSVVGETPNLAARLQALGEPGAVERSPTSRRVPAAMTSVLTHTAPANGGDEQRLSGESSSMETLKDILWPVVLVGGFGAFIDFLIGRAGQEKARDWLLEWWVRFDDVRWRNFGREEGLFAGRLIEKLFGKRIWGIRRTISAIESFLLCLITIYLSFQIRLKPNDIPYFFEKNTALSLLSD